MQQINQCNSEHNGFCEVDLVLEAASRPEIC